MGFTKLDSGIINSSLWNEPPETRVLWITILAMSDENGFVSSSRSGLQRAANLSQERFEEALTTLESPDLDSRSSENDGRRIDKIDGGWVITNFAKYRARTEVIKEQTRERVRKFREKDNVTQCNVTNVTETLPSASASSSSFDTFWKEYPKKTGKGAAERAWGKIKKPSEALQNIITALEWQKQSPQWTKDNGQYIPNPATYLNQRRWEDEKPTSTKKVDKNHFLNVLNGGDR